MSNLASWLDEVEGLLVRESQPSVRELYLTWDHRSQEWRDRASATKSELFPDHEVGIRRRILKLSSELVTHALNRQEYLLVCDVYHETLKVLSSGPELSRDLVALHVGYAKARSRLGFRTEAIRILEPISELAGLEGKDRGSVLFQLGEIVTDEALSVASLAVRRQTGEAARLCFRKAFEQQGNLLKARVFECMLGMIMSDEGSPARKEAAKLAEEVSGSLTGLVSRNGNDVNTVWYRAILEAVCGHVDEAAKSFELLKTMPAVLTSELAEARRHSELLAESLGLPRVHFHSVFPQLQLIVFTGHQPDERTGRKRFPRSLMPQVRELILQKLRSMDARVGFVSAAAGADLLFADALVELGAEFHLILPWSRKEFSRSSVEAFDHGLAEPYWKPMFDRALGNASTVRELGQIYGSIDPVSWEYNQQVTAGLAILTARVARLDVQPMVFWDRSDMGVGSPGSFYELWDKDLMRKPIVIDFPGKTVEPFVQGRERSDKGKLRHEVKSMLFADVVGYSKLSERVMHGFVETFMQRLSGLVDQSVHTPISVKTWGDSLYAVFDEATDAGLFALELTQMIREREGEWVSSGLFYEEEDLVTGYVTKRTINMRVGLHAGPVLMHFNPVTRREDQTGTHVNRAARIEPVAAPGEVYASEEFAALAELDAELRKQSGRPTKARYDNFVCEYAGTMSLAKKFPGRFRIYRVVAKRLFAIDDLAHAAHGIYLENELAKGNGIGKTPALRPWIELAEQYREANRAQVADIPSKLAFLGYELSVGGGIKPHDMEIPADKLEELSKREHDRWMADRIRQGWTFGAVRDNASRFHPSLIPWSDLGEEEKQKDRDTVLNIPKLITRAGFRLKRLLPSR